jgi:hypothetical protein
VPKGTVVENGFKMADKDKMEFLSLIFKEF